MPFATATVLAAASLGLGAAGLGTQFKASRDATSAAKTQAGISQEQALRSAEFTQQEEGINQESAAAQAAASTQSKVFNQAILQGQQGIEAQRFNAMVLAANRQQMEIVRQGQRARSMALASAAAQGAIFGSGLQGGYGQVSGQVNTNLQGVNQNLEIGKNIFGFNSDITNQKIGLNNLQDYLAQTQADLTTRKSQLIQKYADVAAGFQTRFSAAGSDLASAQGLSAIGGGMVQGAGALFSAGMNFNKIFGTPSLGEPLDITYQTRGQPLLPTGIPAPWGKGSLGGYY